MGTGTVHILHRRGGIHSYVGVCIGKYRPANSLLPLLFVHALLGGVLPHGCPTGVKGVGGGDQGARLCRLLCGLAALHVTGCGVAGGVHAVVRAVTRAHCMLGSVV